MLTSLIFDRKAIDVKPTLITLPNGVLWQILEHLDQPRLLAWTSKRFHTLSEDTLWRAKWLMKRYELHNVIYEAIARPKMFTPALLRQLRGLGAPLSLSISYSCCTYSSIRCLLIPFVRGKQLDGVVFLSQPTGLLCTGQRCR